MIKHYINYPDTKIFAICYWNGSDRLMYHNRNYVPDGNVGQLIVLVCDSDY